MREMRRGTERSVKRSYRRAKYAKYIESAAWFARRAQWEQDEKQRTGITTIFCFGGCGKEWSLNDHVHHISYDRLGNEAHVDLAGMCAECHYRLHEIVESATYLRMPRATAQRQGMRTLRWENRSQYEAQHQENSQTR